jgi:transcriptional regulator with XRE-family HTH domain
MWLDGPVIVDDLEATAALLEFGHAIRRAREEAGLTQRDLERRTGIDQTRISRLERGLAPAMRADRIARVVVELGLHVRPPRQGISRRRSA